MMQRASSQKETTAAEFAALAARRQPADTAPPQRPLPERVSACCAMISLDLALHPPEL